jgi:hypothetical protein
VKAQSLDTVLRIIFQRSYETMDVWSGPKIPKIVLAIGKPGAWRMERTVTGVWRCAPRGTLIFGPILPQDLPRNL